LLWESGSGQDIPVVGGVIRWKKRIPLTARNASSLVIGSLCDQAGEENIAVAGLYCSYLVQREHTINCVMGSIPKQLVDRGEVSEDQRKAFRVQNGRGSQLADLMGMLRNVIATIPRVFI